MSPSTPTSDAMTSPHLRSTSPGEVTPMTPIRSTSTASVHTDDDGLDDLFEDETTQGLNLPPIPKFSSSTLADNGHVSNSQKRKRDTAAADHDLDDDASESWQRKKAKSADEDVQEEDEGKGDEAARLYRSLAVAASKKPSTNNASKLFDSMRKQGHIPTAKYVPTSFERRGEVQHLASVHVHHVAPTMLANIETNRDVGGKTSKFDRADKRREITKDQIKAPEYALKKWVDKDDEHITWLVIPASQKYTNMGNSMVPISEIVNKSIKYPQFTFVEAIMGPHKKTGKQVVKAHKLKYEKLTDEQVMARMEVMIKQEKDEIKQAKKDERARARGKKGRRSV